MSLDELLREFKSILDNCAFAAEDYPLRILVTTAAVPGTMLLVPEDEVLAFNLDPSTPFPREVRIHPYDWMRLLSEMYSLNFWHPDGTATIFGIPVVIEK